MARDWKEFNEHHGAWPYTRDDDRCEFCGSEKHTLAKCQLKGAASFRAERESVLRRRHNGVSE